MRIQVCSRNRASCFRHCRNTACFGRTISQISKRSCLRSMTKARVSRCSTDPIAFTGKANKGAEADFCTACSELSCLKCPAYAWNMLFQAPDLTQLEQSCTVNRYEYCLLPQACTHCVQAAHAQDALRSTACVWPTCSLTT